MKILIVPSWYSTKYQISGTFFRDQAIALSRRGHDVTLVCVTVLPIKVKALKYFFTSERYMDENIDVSVYCYPSMAFFRTKFWTFIFYRLYKTIFSKIESRKGRFDIIHAHSFLPSGYVLSKICSQNNYPLIVTEHLSSIPKKNLSKDSIMRLKSTVENANVFACVSAFLKKKVIEYTNASKEIEIIPNILSSDFFLDKSQKKYDCFTFLSAGSLIHGKGFDILIKAFIKAFSNNENVRLNIFGSGQCEKALLKLIKNTRTQIQINPFVPHSKLAEEMRKSHAFVLASRLETFGVVYIEALASGLPTIGTTNGGSDEILFDYGAQSVPVEDIDALSAALCLLYKNYDKYDFDRISSKAQEKYGENAVVNLIEKSYEKAFIDWQKTGRVE